MNQYSEFDCSVCGKVWFRLYDLGIYFDKKHSLDRCPKCLVYDDYFFPKEKETQQEEEGIHISQKDYEFLRFCRESKICRFLFALKS